MNSIMSLVARRVANEFACLAVYSDLQRDSEPPPFWRIEKRYSGDMPLPEAEIKATIVSLFERTWLSALRWTMRRSFTPTIFGSM